MPTPVAPKPIRVVASSAEPSGRAGKKRPVESVGDRLAVDADAEPAAKRRTPPPAPADRLSPPVTPHTRVAPLAPSPDIPHLSRLQVEASYATTDSHRSDAAIDSAASFGRATPPLPVIEQGIKVKPYGRKEVSFLHDADDTALYAMTPTFVQGSFGKIRYAMPLDPADNRVRIVKEVRLVKKDDSKTDVTERHELITELEEMIRTGTQVDRVLEASGSIYAVTDRMAADVKALVKFLQTRRRELPASEYDALMTSLVPRLLAQLAEQLERYHSDGHIHLDMKPDNVHIDGEGNLRLADFGMATSWSGQPLNLDQGTPLYRPPESLAEPHVASDKSDVYALAWIICEVVCGPRERPVRVQMMTWLQNEARGRHVLPKEHKAQGEYMASQSYFTPFRRNPALGRLFSFMVRNMFVGNADLRASAAGVAQFAKTLLAPGDSDLNAQIKSLVTALRRRSDTHYSDDALEKASAQLFAAKALLLTRDN